MAQFRRTKLAQERISRLLVDQYAQSDTVKDLSLAALQAREKIMLPFQREAMRIHRKADERGYSKSWIKDELDTLKKKTLPSLEVLKEESTLVDSIRILKAQISNTTLQALAKHVADPLRAILTGLERQEVRQNMVRKQERADRDHANMLATHPADIPLSDQQRAFPNVIVDTLKEAINDFDNYEEMVIALMDCPNGCELLSKSETKEMEELLSRKLCQDKYDLIDTCEARLLVEKELDLAVDEIITNPLFNAPIEGQYIPVSDSDRLKAHSIPKD